MEPWRSSTERVLSTPSTLELGKRVKLGENVDGNAKTVNRGENVERVLSPANASGHGAHS